MSTKTKAKKPAGEKAQKKARGKTTYVEAAELSAVSDELTEITQRISDAVTEGKLCAYTTYKVLLRRVNGLQATIGKIENYKERGAKTLEKSLARLNASREERGLKALTLDEFLKA